MAISRLASPAPQMRMLFWPGCSPRPRSSTTRSERRRSALSCIGGPRPQICVGLFEAGAVISATIYAYHMKICVYGGRLISVQECTLVDDRLVGDELGLARDQRQRQVHLQVGGQCDVPCTFGRAPGQQQPDVSAAVEAAAGLLDLGKIGRAHV